jgi:adenylate kinase
LRDDAIESLSGPLRSAQGHFATGVTRSREWRIEQLDRMSRLVTENKAALQQAMAKDFKAASQEHIIETLACPRSSFRRASSMSG